VRPIIIRVEGKLRQRVGEEQLELLLEPGTTPRELEALLLTLYPSLRGREFRRHLLQPVLRFAVGGRPALGHQTLADTDEVAVWAAEELPEPGDR